MHLVVQIPPNNPSTLFTTKVKQHSPEAARLTRAHHSKLMCFMKKHSFSLLSMISLVTQSVGMQPSTLWCVCLCTVRFCRTLGRASFVLDVWLQSSNCCAAGTGDSLPQQHQVPLTERGAIPEASEAGFKSLMDSLNRHWTHDGGRPGSITPISHFREPVVCERMRVSTRRVSMFEQLQIVRI